MNAPDPLKQAEQAALDKVNQEKASVSSWFRKNWHWFAALAVVFGLGFIVAKIA